MPSLLGSPRRLLSLAQFPTAQDGTGPGPPSNLRAGLPTPALRGGKRTAQGTYVVGGLKTAAFKGSLGGEGESLQGEGEALTDMRFPGLFLLSRAKEIGKGVPRLLRPQGTCRPKPCCGQGPRLRLIGAGGRRATTQGCFSRARPSPRPAAVRAGAGVLRAGRARTRHPERWAGRTPRAQPAPRPPRSPTHRPGEGRIPASPQSPGLGRPGPPAGGSSTPPPPRPAPLPPLPHTFHRK